MTNYPCVPGHELAGVVTAVGKNVTKYKVAIIMMMIFMMTMIFMMNMMIMNTSIQIQLLAEMIMMTMIFMMNMKMNMSIQPLAEVIMIRMSLIILVTIFTIIMLKLLL